MKNQTLFSSRDKSKKLKCRLTQFLFGALRINFIKVMFVKYVLLFLCLFRVKVVYPFQL